MGRTNETVAVKTQTLPEKKKYGQLVTIAGERVHAIRTSWVIQARRAASMERSRTTRAIISISLVDALQRNEPPGESGEGTATTTKAPGWRRRRREAG